MARTFGKLVIVFLVFAAIAFGLMKFAAKSRTGGPAAIDAGPVPVFGAAAERGTLEVDVEVTGRLQARLEATLSGQVEGRLAEIPIEPGDRVAAGQQLGRVDDVEYAIRWKQAELDYRTVLTKIGVDDPNGRGTVEIENTSIVKKARASYENARLSHARLLELSRQQVNTRQSLDDVTSRLKVAEADLQAAREEAANLIFALRGRRLAADLAKKKFDDCVLIAPFAGFVQKRLASPGEWVRVGNPLCTVIAVDPIRFRGTLPENDARNVAVGQPVAVRVDAVDDEFTVPVARMNPATNPDSHAVEIEADLANTADLLRPGYYAVARVKVEARPVVYVPVEAVDGIAGVTRVFAVENGIAREHRVEILRRESGRVAVRNGLKGGETLAASNVSRLHDGVAVTLVGKPAASSADPAQGR